MNRFAANLSIFWFCLFKVPYFSIFKKIISVSVIQLGTINVLFSVTELLSVFCEFAELFCFSGFPLFTFCSEVFLRAFCHLHYMCAYLCFVYLYVFFKLLNSLVTAVVVVLKTWTSSFLLSISMVSCSFCISPLFYSSCFVMSGIPCH